MQVYEILTYSANLFIAITLYIAVLIFMRYYKVIKKREQIEKRKYTLNYCFADKRNYEEILSRKKIPYYRQMKEMDISKEYLNIMEVLSEFEKIAIGIKVEIFDEEIIKSYYGYYFIGFFEIYKYYLLKYRDDNRTPYLFIEYEKFVNKIGKDVDYLSNTLRGEYGQ